MAQHVKINAQPEANCRSSIDAIPPPPYELLASGPFPSTQSSVKANGTLDVVLLTSDPVKLYSLIPDAEPTTPTFKPPLSSTRQRSEQVPSLNIVIHVVGSRGDVQPFIAYGTELQRRGHRIRLATHGVFDKFVRDSGLEFFDIGGDPADLMAYMVKNPGLMPSLESLRSGDIGRKRKMIAEMLEGSWRSCIEPDAMTGKSFVADAIIANPPSFAHVHCAQALGIPVHIVFTMPWSPTRSFPHPLVKMSATDMEPGVANWLTYGIVELMTWQGLGDVINNWRRKTLDLEPLSPTMGPSIVTYLKIPHTYCWSPALVPKPFDWGKEIDVCGFFLRDEPEYTPPQDLARFLSAGPPPLYVGFGSIVLEDPERLHRVILEAARACGLRLLISRGWSKLGGNSKSDDEVFYLGDCPHEWLFKQVAAVIHHGGAGTTACGLINANPTLIVPFFGDQPFWGSVIASAGAGPAPIPQEELRTDVLIRAFQFITSSPAAAAAQAIADMMRQEAGVQAAVESFHNHLPLDKMMCNILPGQVARWVVRKRKRAIRLSDQAVAVLIVQKLVKLSDLESLRTKEFNTDTQRWDPISGGAASTLRVMTDFTASFGGLFIDPYKAHRHAFAKDGNASLAAGKATATASSSLAKMAGVLARGALVDTPVALADGMRNVPRLYREDVKDYGKVTDWKDGGKVAAKNFAAEFYHGITGVVVQPWQGAKEEGVMGFMKGAGKGTVGFVTKPGAAMFGLLGYPALGIQKSLMARTVRSAATLRARRAQVDALATEKPPPNNHEVQQMTSRFQRLSDEA